MKTLETNDKIFKLTFTDKNNQPCEEKDAYMVAISEYDKDNNFIQSTIGYVKTN